MYNMQKKEVYKDMLSLWKKTLYVSLKIASLLLLVLLISYSVSAQIINNAHSYPMVALDGTDSTETGMLFFVNGTLNLTITHAYKHASEQSTNCYLYFENSVTPLVGGDFSGNNCTFNQSYNLVPNNNYRITFAKIGSTRSRYKNAAASFPELVQPIQWLAGTYRTTGDWLSNTTGVAYSVNSFDIENVTLCISDIQNTTFTDWVHMQDCDYNNLQDENRSYNVVDLNGCVSNQTIYEYRNHTCYTSTDVYQEMKVNNMFIGLIFLYITFLILGNFMLRSGNVTSGFMFFGLTIPIDFLIVHQLYTYFVEGNVIDSTWQSAFLWIFGIGLLFWLIIKISVPFVYKWKG